MECPLSYFIRTGYVACHFVRECCNNLAMDYTARYMKYSLLFLAVVALMQLGYFYGFQSMMIAGTGLINNIRLQKRYDATMCKPVHHVFYMRTFKTSSSTITEIMHRYVFRHGLTAAMSEKFVFPERLSKKYILSYGDPHASGPYDFLAEHHRYDKKSLNEILHNDTVLITSLRHPIDQLKSFFNEFKVAKIFGINSGDPVRTYFENGNISKRHKGRIPRAVKGLPAINAFQFGLNSTDMADTAAILKTVNVADRDFKLVMITEYLDESLLLLKRTLCWDMKDIIYLSLRKRIYKLKSEFYGPKLRRRIETQISADYKLYYHFLDKFWKTLVLQDQSFWEELWIFKNVLGQVNEFCRDITVQLSKNASCIFDLAGDIETGQGRKVINLDPLPFSQRFQVDAVYCAIMSLKTVISNNVLMATVQVPQVCTVPVRHTAPLKMKIVMKFPNESYINELYCTERSKFYKVPLQVLAQNEAYMWSDEGVQSPSESE